MLRKTLMIKAHVAFYWLQLFCHRRKCINMIQAGCLHSAVAQKITHFPEPGGEIIKLPSLYRFNEK